MVENKRPALRLSNFAKQSLSETAPTATEASRVAPEGPLSLFVEDPDQPRTEFSPEKHAELVADVRVRGVLQPVIVRDIGDGTLMIRHGARRLRAARELGLDTLPYLIQTDDRQRDRYAQIAENETREGHTPMDLARFVISEIEDYKTSQKEVAAKLHKTEAIISYLVSLAKSPGFVLDLYNSGKCRAPETLYMIRKLWEKYPQVVERRCATQETLTAAFVRALKDSLEGEVDPSKKKRSKGKSPAKNQSRPFAFTSPGIAVRKFMMQGKPVVIVGGGITVRTEDGSELAVVGDALAEVLLAASQASNA